MSSPFQAAKATLRDYKFWEVHEREHTTFSYEILKLPAVTLPRTPCVSKFPMLILFVWPDIKVWEIHEQNLVMVIF